MFLEFEDKDGVFESVQSYRGTTVTYRVTADADGAAVTASLPDGILMLSSKYPSRQEAVDAAERLATDIAFGDKDAELGARITLPDTFIEGELA